MKDDDNSVDEFPQITLRPEVTVNHGLHLEVLKTDLEGYEKVGCRKKDQFVWFLRAFENLSLPTVKNQYLDSLAITKTRLAMFDILIDDKVDNPKVRDFNLIEHLLRIPFNYESYENSNLSTKDIEYLNFARKLWQEIIEEVKKYPKYKRYEDEFNFDLKMLVTAVEYSKFVNIHPNAANLIENGAYVPHGMTFIIQTDWDLMCSEGFDDSELGILRELAYTEQKMGGLGNLIATYPRELIESNMSSEALVRFQKEFGIDFRFKINRLLNNKKRYPEFEKQLMEEWQDLYLLAKEIAKNIKSMDVDKFLRECEFVQKAYFIKNY